MGGTRDVAANSVLRSCELGSLCADGMWVEPRLVPASSRTQGGLKTTGRLWFWEEHVPNLTANSPW